MKDYFLFRAAPPETGRWRKLAYWLWNTVPAIAATLLVGLASLYYATGNFYQPMFLSYLKNHWIVLLNLAPVVFLALLVYFAAGRAWIGFFTASAVTMALTWVSFFKLTFRNDPLLFEDLLLVREAGNMAGQYGPFVTTGMALVIFFIVAVTVILALFARAKPNRWVRLIGAVIVLGSVLPLWNAYSSPEVYAVKTSNPSLISIWASTDQYVSRGFVYPFLHSAATLADHPPDGYTEAMARTVLNAYEDADIPDERKVSIIAIQLEAFQDFSRFGTPALAYDLYAPYHALEAEGVSGDLVTNIFAGGTVDTERGFLTGGGDFGSLRVATNSYAWYFRSQGYTVEGMHPCYQWFYNRANINEYLGFEYYWFVENYFSPMTGGEIGLDNVFFPELRALYDANRQTGKPYFNFSVTYQGHGPYTTDRCWWGEPGDFVRQGPYTEEQQYILDNYFGSVADTIGYLADFANYLRAQDDPVVLVVFGDHNPWMGDANSVYHAIGLDLDLSTEQGFMNYYTTRYLIWANPAAKAVLGGDLTGTGPTLSPCFLMAEVFSRCGIAGPAIAQVSAEAMARVPVVHSTGVYWEDGTLTDTLSPEGQAVIDDYTRAYYYWKKNFQYRTP